MNLKLNFLVTILFVSLNACQTEKVSPKSKESQSLKDFDCLSKITGKSLTLNEVNKYLFGSWQLNGIYTMLPSKEIPDLKLVLTSIPNSLSVTAIAEIFEKGISKGKVKFTLKEMKWEDYVSVIIESENVSLESDCYNFLKGNIIICENELMIDNGMAFDAPAYLFRKI